MKYKYTLMTILFFAVGLAYLAYWTWDDFQHPERWDEGAAHDPRVYLTYTAIILPASVGFIVFNVWRLRQDAVQEFRRAWLLREAQRKRQAGEFEEANRLLDEFVVLYYKAYDKLPSGRKLGAVRGDW